MGPIDQAINSVRGRAAQSVATLLFADRDRWSALKLTVEKLVVDPVLAVRSVAVECLLAVPGHPSRGSPLRLPTADRRSGADPRK